MMKKFTAVLSAAVIMLSSSVYAQSEINIERIGFSPVERALTVSGTCTEAKDKRQVLEQITDENGVITGAAQSEVKGGRFSIEKYLLPDNLAVGEYTINISLMGGENITDENAFYYGGSEKAMQVLNLIDKSKTVEEINLIINENHKPLGFLDYDIYSKCTSKEHLLEELISIDFSADESNLKAKWQSLLDILSKNTLLTYFSDTTSAEDIKMLVENKEYLEAMGMETGETYESLSESGRNAAYAIIAADSSDTLEGAYAMFKKGCLLAFLRNSRYTEVEKALRDNSDIADIDYTVYNKLSAEKKNAVMKAASIYAQTQSDITAICRFFENEAKKEAQNDSDGGSGGSGSGGGGSSGGSSGGGNSSYVYGGQINPSSGNIGTGNGADVSFSDLETVPWAYEAITALANKGVLSGIGGGLFAPNDNVTRAQFCKMICECFGINAQGNAVFSDVSADSWYYGYVTGLANAGIINGMGDGRFEPESTVTRQDISVMLVRIIDKMGYAIPKYEHTEAFADDGDIAGYAKSSMYDLFSYGILTGTDGKAMPQENATRAQAAALIYRTEVARWQNGE